MIRVTKMSSGFYGKKIDIDSKLDRVDIDTLTNEGTPVILVYELDDLENLGIDPSKVKMIE